MDKNNTIFKLVLIVLAFFASATLTMGQVTVSGKITDAEDGSGIPGANILESGTSSGTVTDFEGNFTLSVQGASSVLIFSFVGYATQEITVGSQSTINVQLAIDVTALSEVVVVGYGTQQRKEITSAVASVGEEDFNKGLVNRQGLV